MLIEFSSGRKKPISLVDFLSKTCIYKAHLFKFDNILQQMYIVLIKIELIHIN